MKKKILKLFSVIAICLLTFPSSVAKALEKLGDATNFTIDQTTNVWSFDVPENATNYSIMLYEDDGTDAGNYTGGNMGGLIGEKTSITYNASSYMIYSHSYFIKVTFSADGYESSVTISDDFTSIITSLAKNSSMLWDGQIAKFKIADDNTTSVTLNLYKALSSSSSENKFSDDVDLSKLTKEGNYYYFDFSSYIEDGYTYYYTTINKTDGFTSSAEAKSNLLKNNLPKLKAPLVTYEEGFGFIFSSEYSNYSFAIYKEDGTYTGINYGTQCNYLLLDEIASKLVDGEKYYATLMVTGDDYTSSNSDVTETEVFTYKAPTYYNDTTNYIKIGKLVINDLIADNIVKYLNIIEPDSATGFVTYDDITKTLTLNNFKYTTDGVFYGTEYQTIVLNVTSGATINVIGSNEINLTNTKSAGSEVFYNWYGTLTFTGSGKLNINSKYNGIRANSAIFNGPEVEINAAYRPYYSASTSGFVVNAGKVTLINTKSGYETIKTGTPVTLASGYSLLAGADASSAILLHDDGSFNTSDLTSFISYRYTVITKRESIDKNKFTIDLKEFDANDEVQVPIVTCTEYTLDKDYKITYYTDSNLISEIAKEEIKNAGIYYMKIEGINYYKDSFVESFIINPTYEITVTTADASGTVTITGSNKYKAGVSITITATPNAGYVFDYWTDRNGVKLENTLSTYTFTASEDNTYTAWFAKAHTVKFVTNGGSAIPDIILKDGATLESITEPTKEGYTFIGWYYDPDLTQSFSNYNEIYDDITLYAKFEINRYTITPSTILNASITVAGSANYNENVILIVIPNDGYEISGIKIYDDSWNDITSIVNFANNRFTMPASNVNILVYLNKIQYTITKSTTTGGETTIVKIAESGDSVSLYTIPNSGYKVSSVKIYDASNKNITSAVGYANNKFTMPASNITVKVTYTKKVVGDSQEMYLYGTTYNTIGIHWEKLSNASGYKIYRSTDNKTFTKIATLTSSDNHYVDKTVLTNTKYYYKVLAYKKVDGVTTNGKCTKVQYSTPKLTTPVIKGSTNMFNYVKITYAKVSGTTKYVIYRSTSKTGTYSKIGTTTSLTYYDKTASIGKTYYYKVRAYRLVNKSNKYSSYSNVVKGVRLSNTITYSLTSGTKSITVNITKNSNAKKYYLYRSIDNKTYTKVATIVASDYSGSTIKYKDSGLKANKKYYYKLKLVNGNTSNYTNTKYKYTK